MNNKTIIFSTIGFLLASFIFLSFVEQKKQDANSQNWWALYFENPKSESLNFKIENHSNSTTFQWEIFLGKTSASKGSVVMEKGQQKTIPVSSKGIANQKVTITVTDSENNKKEVYKNL